MDGAYHAGRYYALIIDLMVPSANLITTRGTENKRRRIVAIFPILKSPANWKPGSRFFL